MEVESIKRHFKSRLVGTVLNGYLCLRKLVVQRTKLIDETQDMLLEMLEDMTTGQDRLKSSNMKPKPAETRVLLLLLLLRVCVCLKHQCCQICAALRDRV